jgi:cell wall-associated NlpC family hydrolase
MAPRAGISGFGLAVAGMGGVLVYAGLRGVSPLQALRDITSGKPPGIGVQKRFRPKITGSSSGAGSGVSALVDAARANSGDSYSQARRWQPGYSDCSSYVGKAFKAAGITPPGASTTASYLTSPRFTKISRSQAQAGDLAVTTSHMAIFTGPDTGIGQQNAKRNVVEGAIDDVMYPNKAFTVLRYTGTTERSAQV